MTPMPRPHSTSHVILNEAKLNTPPFGVFPLRGSQSGAKNPSASGFIPSEARNPSVSSSANKP